MAVNNKIISKTGAWYSYGDIRIGQGRENARNFLKDNPEVCAEIERTIRRLMDESKPVVTEEMVDSEKEEFRDDE